LEIQSRGTVSNETRQIFASADDIVLVGRTVGVLNEATTNRTKAAKEMDSQLICKILNTWK
jgi:hypothetical protein